MLVTSGNTLVSGLKASDFELRDSGVLQRVEQIEVERIPLNIVFVLDTSGSVAGPRLYSLLTAGRALVSGLRSADRVTLLSFGTRVRLLTPLTHDGAAEAYVRAIAVMPHAESATLAVVPF